MKKFLALALVALVSAPFALDIGAVKKAASNTANTAVTTTKEAARTEVTTTTNAVLGTPDTAKKAEAAPVAAAPAVDTAKPAPVVAAPAVDSSKIAETAYLIAEKRDFASGYARSDWLKAESKVEDVLNTGFIERRNVAIADRRNEATINRRISAS